MQIQVTLSIFCFLFFIALPPGTAQENLVYSFDFGEPEKWTLLEKNMKILYYYTESEELIAFDYLNREILWRRSIPGIRSNKAGFVESFPYLWLHDVKSGKKGFNKSRSLLLSQVDGSIMLDSDHIALDNFDNYHVSYDRGLCLMAGKLDKQKVLAAFEFGQNALSWTVEPPNPAKGPLQSHKIADKFAVNNEHAVVNYNGLLIALDISNGDVAWTRPSNSGNFKGFLQKPGPARLDDPNFYVIETNDDQYTLMAYRMKDGERAWPENCILGSSYSLSGREDDIYVETLKSLNRIGYMEGKFLITDPPRFAEDLIKVYGHQNGYSAWLSKPKAGTPPSIPLRSRTEATHSWGVQWIEEDLSTLRWTNMTEVQGTELLAIRQYGDKLWYRTDRSTGYIDLQSGNLIASFNELSSQAMVLQDTLLPGAVIFQNNTLFTLNSSEGVLKMILEKIKLPDKKDTIREVRVLPHGIALLGDRNMVSVHREGGVAHTNGFKRPADWGKMGKNLLLIGVGILFQDEMKELNRALYEADLISGAEASRNTMAMYQFGGLGSGTVAQNFANRFIKEKQNTTGRFTRLNRLWIVPDKLASKSHGLRLVDAFTGIEVKQIELSSRADYGYLMDLSVEQLFRVEDGKLQAFELRF